MMITNRDIKRVLSQTDTLGIVHIAEDVEESVLHFLLSHGYMYFSDYGNDKAIYRITNIGTDFMYPPQQYVLPCGERLIITQETIDNENNEVWVHIVCSKKAFAVLQEVESNWRKSN